jgi:hypothetical protein
MSGTVAVSSKGGAPLGDINSQRHGLRGSKLPKQCRYVERRLNRLRDEQETAVLAVKGEMSLLDAAAITSAVKWERHGLLAAHWLRHEADRLSAADRLRFSEAVAKASDNRDRNIRLLALDRDARDSIIDQLYARPQPAPGAPGPPISAGNGPSSRRGRPGSRHGATRRRGRRAA